MDETSTGAGDPSATSAASPSHPRMAAGVAAIAITVILLDQAAKITAVDALTPGLPVPVVDGVIRFTLTRNAGAAFSMATGTTWLFTMIAVVVVVVILRTVRRLGSWWWAAALGLLLGGAVGNLLDRLFRAPGFGRGHVVDFIQFPHFPVFNIADSSIVVSAFLIGWLGLRGIGIDGRSVADRPARPPRAGG
jgi:signal peptidase II